MSLWQCTFTQHGLRSLVDRADVILDRKKRAPLYIQAQHIALSQGAFISLIEDLSSELVKPYVHGLIGSEALNGYYPAYCST